jgi:hypothetical protein
MEKQRMNGEVEKYAEARDRETQRIAEALREPLRALGYVLTDTFLGIGQGIVDRDGKPPRPDVTFSIHAREVREFD